MMDKLQFLVLIFAVILSKLCNVSREIIGLYAHHGGLNLRPLHIGTFHTPTEDDSTPNPSLVLDI